MSLTEPPIWMALDPSDPEGLRRWMPRMDRHLIYRIWRQGTLEGLEVTPSSPADWNVRVSPGWAVVEGADQADQGSYLVHLPNAVTVPINPPGATTSIYNIGLVVRDTEAGGPAGDNGEVLALPGLPPTAIELAEVAISPTDVAITDHHISLDNRQVGGLRGSDYAVGQLYYAKNTGQAFSSTVGTRMRLPGTLGNFTVPTRRRVRMTISGQLDATAANNYNRVAGRIDSIERVAMQAMIPHSNTWESRTAVDEVIIDAGTHSADMVVLKVHGSGSSRVIAQAGRIFIDDHGPV